jgi:phage virion morphogenesis protein
VLSFEADSSEVQAALQRLIASTTNPRPALLAIGETLTETTKHRFASKTDPDGNRWEDNSDVTQWALKKLPAGGYEMKGRNDPLVDHGALGNTITYQLLGNDGVMIGSPMEYAAMMQFGGSKSEFPQLWGDIPARPFLGISEEDKTEILRIIENYLR